MTVIEGRTMAGRDRRNRWYWALLISVRLIANALPLITWRGRSFSWPESLPKTKGPAGISISGLSVTGWPAHAAPAEARTVMQAMSALEIDTIAVFPIEQEDTIRRYLDADHLIEIADEVLVGAHATAAGRRHGR